VSEFDDHAITAAYGRGMIGSHRSSNRQELPALFIDHIDRR
jgi:hypothetical protein